MHASPLVIHGKSRMRKRACTDLCGGATSDGRPYREQLSINGLGGGDQCDFLEADLWPAWLKLRTGITSDLPVIRSESLASTNGTVRLCP
jgi:hypothetical protein